MLTIGAGGGSLAWIDKAGSLRNGPQSAGAEPGPACYGHGGEEPTNTDANLLLGRLGTELIGGGMELDRDAAEAAIRARSPSRSGSSDGRRGRGDRGRERQHGRRGPADLDPQGL